MRITPVKTIYSIFIAVFFAFALTACPGGGGDDAGSAFGSGGGAGGGNGDGSGGGGAAGPTSPSTGISIGSFDNSNTFQKGDIGVGQSPLAAGGSSSLSIAFVDAQGIPVADTITVTFLSTCLAQGKAEIRDASGAVVGTVSTISGGANATYVAKGCTGTDNIIARATVGGDTVEAKGSIQVLAANVGGLQFISATPEVIGIKGTGILPESAQLVFQVNDSSGSPATGKTVTFVLDTTVGGITLSTNSATSGSDGRVTVTVSSGTQATSVRVRATTTGANNTTLTSESDALAITTGVADADSFSLSGEIFNPQGFDFDGATSDISILAGDAVNNPVPDGFNINFATEGGVIEGSCKTNDNTDPQSQPVTGGCSVQWTSQDPRPPADGRTTILASAIGVESFTDQDGDGQFDDTEPFDDLGEPFNDENENGVYNLGKFFIDFNTNGIRDGGNGRYDGLLCDPAATLCNKGTVAIGSNVVLVMAESSPAVTFLSTFPVPDFLPGETKVVTFLIVGDDLGQVLPVETSVGLASVGNGGFTVLDPATLNVGNTSAMPGVTSDTVFSFSIKAPDTCAPSADTMNLTVGVPEPGNTDFFFQFGVNCP